MKKLFWILFITPSFYSQDILMTNKTKLHIPIRTVNSDSVVITYNDGFYVKPIDMCKVKSLNFWNLQVGTYDLMVYFDGEIVEEKCIEIIPIKYTLAKSKSN